MIAGWRLCERFSEVNLNLEGSQVEKTGMLCKTKSWLPPSEDIFKAEALTSLHRFRRLPAPGPKVDMRANALLFMPMPV
jgi:hypothetical protein